MFIMYCVFQVCSVFVVVNADEVHSTAVSLEEDGLPAVGEAAAWESEFGTSEFNKHMLPYPLMQAVEEDWGHIGADPKAVFIPTGTKYASLP
jgi:hypothetical protein